MAHFTRDSGLQARKVEWESFIGPMVKSTRVSLKITNAMAPVLCTILAARNLKGNGRQVRRMADAFTPGLMALNTT